MIKTRSAVERPSTKRIKKEQRNRTSQKLRRGVGRERMELQAVRKKWKHFIPNGPSALVEEALKLPVVLRVRDDEKAVVAQGKGGAEGSRSKAPLATQREYSVLQRTGEAKSRILCGRRESVPTAVKRTALPGERAEREKRTIIEGRNSGVVINTLKGERENRGADDLYLGSSFEAKIIRTAVIYKQMPKGKS